MAPYGHRLLVGIAMASNLVASFDAVAAWAMTGPVAIADAAAVAAEVDAAAVAVAADAARAAAFVMTAANVEVSMVFL